MTFRVVLFVFFTLLALIVIIPFIFSIAGVKILQFGSVGGGPSSSIESLLRSVDEGDIWENVSKSADKRLAFPQQILDLSFHPKDPDILYAGSKGAGLWKSNDTGKSWQKIFDASKILLPEADVYKVAISSSTPDVIYLAVFQDKRGRVLKSDNGAKSFREIYFTSVNQAGVYDIYVSPANSDVLSVITGQGGILESSTGGRTWKVRQWFIQALTKIMVNPVLSAERYLITGRREFFKTFDGGENWTKLEFLEDENAQIGRGFETSGRVGDQRVVGFPPSEEFFASPFSSSGSASRFEVIVMDPVRSATLFMGSRAGLSKSINGGFTWSRINVLIPPEALPVEAVAVRPYNNRVIFVGASSQLHQSRDGGINWSAKILPIKTRIKKLLFHPLRPEVMFAVLGR